MIPPEVSKSMFLKCEPRIGTTKIALSISRRAEDTDFLRSHLGPNLTSPLTSHLSLELMALIYMTQLILCILW